MTERANDDGVENKLLTEEQLRHLSRHSRTFVPQHDSQVLSDDDINKLTSTFNDVFQVAESAIFSTTHRVAAWNTLCALIDQCSEFSSELSKDFIWSHRVWDRTLDLYLDRSHDARPKSSKQLLATIASCLSKANNNQRTLDQVAKRLSVYLVRDDDIQRTKACMQALILFLKKDIVPLPVVLRCLSMGSSDEEDSADGVDQPADVQDLLLILFSWLGRGDFGSTIGQLVSVVLANYDASTGAIPSHLFWAEPLNDVVHTGTVQIADLRIHVLPALFGRSLNDYMAFLQAHGLQRLVSGSTGAKLDDNTHDRPNDDLLYAAIRCGKEVGLLLDTDNQEISQTSSAILLPVRCINGLLCQSSSTARLTGLSFLISSHSATRPLTRKTIDILRRNLSYFFADIDADFRSEVFSLMQRLMDRIRAITAVLARRAHTDESAAKSFVQHRSFLEWLLQLLGWELRPTASYQRHISALKILLIVARSGLDDVVTTKHFSKSALAETKWPFHLSVLNSGLRRLLLDLLMDPFDDVRQTSAAIMSMYVKTDEYACSLLSKTIDRAESSMLATGRADQADGVAYLYSLLSQECYDEVAVPTRDRPGHSYVLVQLIETLERMLDIARRSLATATSKYPVHGLFTSLRYIMIQNDCRLDLDNISERLDTCLYTIWDIVQPVLCDDAPEGYIPEDSMETAAISTKDTLSYCWRALKESSLLLGTIISQKRVETNRMLSLSTLCFTQLAELRHRGAFSTVAQTWASCCVRCYDLENKNEPNPIRSWYAKVVENLSDKLTINTRRSAGLPSLICGLLISDKSGQLIAQAFHDLTKISYQRVESSEAQASSLPQVHALNCIKDVLRHTHLAEQSERYVPQSFSLAAESLRSESWAIRNCGLMLFRAAIDRLLGTNESHLNDDDLSGQQASIKLQPELVSVILELLVTDQSSMSDSHGNGNIPIFPALQLLQRVRIPESRHEEVKRAVYTLVSSPSWHIRNKAARTYATLCDASQTDLELSRMLNVVTVKQNALHGALLCARHLVLKSRKTQHSSFLDASWSKRKPERDSRCDSGLVSNQLHEVVSAAQQLYYENLCPITKAAYIDLLGETYRCTQDLSTVTPRLHRVLEQGSDQASNMLDIAEELGNMLATEHQAPGDSILMRSLAICFSYEVCRADKPVYKEHDISSLICRLGQVNSDACAALFGEVRHIRMFDGLTSTPTFDSLLRASCDILSGHYGIKLKCEVQGFLLASGEQGNSSIADAIVHSCASATLPLHENGNQQYADQWLQLQAVALERRLKGRDGPPEAFREELTGWIKACESATQQTSDLIYTREAAAMAIDQLHSTWSYLHSENSNQYFKLCIAIYDLLNDDDEDIRLKAAGVTSRILACTPETKVDRVLVPSKACQALVRFIIQRWSTDSCLWREAFSRAFAVGETGYVSVADQLAALADVDTALFAEEKQNLYIDDAQEVRLWSHVLMFIDPSTIPKPLVKCCASWVDNGLDALLTQATSGTDGPLGWSTRPEIFNLGLQVFYGVEVLLRLSERGLKLPIRPSWLRLKLGRFAAVAAAHGVNVLWMRKIERVLHASILQKVVDCGRLIHSVMLHAAET